MFAVVRTGGKQYRVAPGDKIVVEKLDGEAGSRVDISDVLLAGDGANLQSVEGLTVAAEIVAQAKAEKVTVFKKRRRHNYRRKKGHRQQHTILKIVAIGDQRADDKGAKAAKPAKSSAAPASGSETASLAVDEQTIPNPAPDNPEQANPGAGQASADEGTKAAKPRKPKAAKAASTDDAAPANGGDNESSKA